MHDWFTVNPSPSQTNVVNDQKISGQIIQEMFTRNVIFQHIFLLIDLYTEKKIPRIYFFIENSQKCKLIDLSRKKK